MMILKSIYNFFSNTYKEISEVIDDDADTVDTSMGRKTPSEIMEIVLPIAREKQFINAGEQASLTPEPPILLNYTRRKQLVWSVYFAHYFTEEERATNYKGFRSMLLACIKVNDATGEVILAEPIRPVFYEDHM